MGEVTKAEKQPEYGEQVYVENIPQDDRIINFTISSLDRQIVRLQAQLDILNIRKTAALAA